MMKDNFYMHLPSNSSMNKYFPQNKTSHFKTKLPQTINFKKDKWETALVEILFPNSWHNIREPFNYIKYIWNYDEGGEQWVTEKLIPGWYNIDDLLKKITQNLFTKHRQLSSLDESEKKLQKFTFKYDKKLNRVYLKGEQSNTGAIYLNHELGTILGYGGWRELSLKTNEINNYAPGITNVHFSTPKYLYIYADMIEEQIVGGDKHQLLRSVNVGQSVYEQSRDSVISKIFDRIFYIPVKSQEIDTIEVNIKQEGGGELAPFDSGGISTLVLHFRKL